LKTITEEENAMIERGVAEAFPPGEFLRDELEARGWTQEEFASIIRRSPAVVNQILSGKRGISPETARELGAALGTSAMYWMNLEAAYRLWKAGPAPTRIRDEASVRAEYPVREMLKRGWLQGSEDPHVLRQQVLEFFGIRRVGDAPRLMHAAKKSGYPDEISGAQRAWLFRVRQIASSMKLRPYSEAALADSIAELKRALETASGVAIAPAILAKCGVCFVVVEHVPSSKIDGVCFWLDSRPVIGMSLRMDRIDNFWFVLRHEIEHVLRREGRETAIVDSDTIGDLGTKSSREELRADAAAADFCVSAAEMSDFFSRHRPIFSESDVLKFAARMRVHPGLVVGQLQRRTDNYRLLRKYLVPIRATVAAKATADGYGYALSL
jgi:HTH-type transcriptional regulator/antitoxin HigA